MFSSLLIRPNPQILDQHLHNNFSHSRNLMAPAFLPCHADPCMLPLDLHCNEDQVYDLIIALDCEASGNDDPLARMLKAAACSIVLSCTKLFNLSICTCNCSQKWKLARVVCIHKEKGSTDSANYGPISILPILSSP